MTFNREERYIVIKRKDLKFASVENKLLDFLNEAGIQTRECVVVESDWPEYEIVWEMLQDRVEGKPNRVEQLENELANMTKRQQRDRIEHLERELANARDIAKKLTGDVLRRGQRLAESQAREAQMREAITNGLKAGATKGPLAIASALNEALSLPTDDTALRQAIAQELREAADYADANNVCGNVSMDWLRRRSDELEHGK